MSDEPNQIEADRRPLADLAWLLSFTAHPDASPDTLHRLVAIAQRQEAREARRRDL